jgi:site-specific recombinase
MGRHGNSWRRRGAGSTQRQCMDALARSIADRCARADIEEFCEREGDHYVVPVFPAASGKAQQEVWKAMAYLELRGLLVHDPVRPNFVRLL